MNTRKNNDPKRGPTNDSLAKNNATSASADKLVSKLNSNHKKIEIENKNRAIFNLFFWPLIIVRNAKIKVNDAVIVSNTLTITSIAQYNVKYF